MGSSIIINGKFLSAAPTGVHRVAQELANALVDIIEKDAGLSAEIWLPHNGASRSGMMRLPVRIKGPLRSIPWEQLTLPLAARSRLIVNLCNIGPVLSRNAITMIHDAQVHTTPASYKFGFRMWYKLVQPLIARRHRHILTVSKYSRDQLIAAGLGDARSISVIHNGVDHVVSVPPDNSIIERMGLTPQTYVVALASTQAHKNITLLLKAFAGTGLADIKLVLVGSAKSADFPDPSLAGAPNVMFAGRVSDGELRALYESALCVAFPSTTEGFGLPPMEAMYVGCPAIVAPCGALPEICGEAAIYVDPTQPAAWAEAIRKLAADKAHWQQWSAAAREHAQLFSWRKAAEKLVVVIAEHQKQGVRIGRQVAYVPA